ncbi:MAG: DUF6364 family protein [Thermoanaerobaculia bacterium]
MTLTLSIDEELAQRARQIAEGMGMTLEQLILRYLEDLESQSAQSSAKRILRRSAASPVGEFTGMEVQSRRNP